MILTTTIFFMMKHKYMELQLRSNSRFPATATTIRGFRDLGFTGKHHNHQGVYCETPGNIPVG